MEKRKWISIVGCILAGFCLAVFLYWNREAKSQSPFLREYVFESVSEATQGSDGNIYIADVISGKQGNRIQKERIIKITGHQREIVYEFDYAFSEDPPLQYGGILELQEYEGSVYFLKKEDERIDIYRLSTADEACQVENFSSFSLYTCAHVNPDTNDA